MTHFDTITVSASGTDTAERLFGCPVLGYAPLMAGEPFGVRAAGTATTWRWVPFPLFVAPGAGDGGRGLRFV